MKKGRQPENGYDECTNNTHSPAELLVCPNVFYEAPGLRENHADGHHDQAKPEAEEQGHGQPLRCSSGPYGGEQCGNGCRARYEATGDAKQKQIPFGKGC